MSDPQPVHVGEILKGIRAADHNAFYETWRFVKQWRAAFTPPPQSAFADRLVVPVFNETGAEIDTEFPILKLTGPSFNTEDRESIIYQPIAFDGDTPDTDTHEGNVAIIQGPLGDGMKGHGVITGHTWVKVNWTDEAHEFAAVEDGENTRLKSSSSGIKIIWHEEIPDPEYLPMELWALILLGGGSSGNTTLESIFMVVTDEILAATGDITSIDPGFGSAQLYAIEPSTKSRTPVGDPVVVYNYDTTLSYPERFEIFCIYHPIEETDPPFYEVILGACSPLDEGS